MLRFQSSKGIRFCDGMTRRDFLHAGTLAGGSLGLNLADLSRLQAAGATPNRDINCIILFLVGGPSHLDTWDLKPHAPDKIRGPFRPIQTNVPTIQISEHFPLMAKMADRYAIIRSVYHREAAIHETGHQLMQTGHLFRDGLEYPHYGAALCHLHGPVRGGLPSFAVIPGPIGNTGISVSHGQTAGFLGQEHEPIFGNGGRTSGLDPANLRSRYELLTAVDDVQRAFDVRKSSGTQPDSNRQALNTIFSPNTRRAFDITTENDNLRNRYGRNTFGQSCLLARRLVEHGIRLVTVNMFDTVFNQTTWDCHADGRTLGATLDDYKKTLCPMFDLAYTTLLDDLRERGMLDNTMVVAMGEFGRTPHLNAGGGRDHWPGVWSILFAGGKVRGGQVIGASDRIGAEPLDRPVDPAMVAATIYQGLGINLNTRIPGPGNRSLSLTEAQAVDELFCG